MEICASKLSLVCFFLLFVLLQQGRSQNLVSGDMDSLALGLIDTNAFLEGRWKSIEHQIEIENISTAQKLLGEYRSIAHHYGFRFENEFRSARSNFSYNYLGDELFVLEDAGNDLDIYSIIKPEYQEKFVPNNNENIQRDVLEVIPLPTTYKAASTYWAKLYATNTSREKQEAWFMVGWNERSWAEIVAYKVEGNNIQKIGVSGYSLPLAEKMAADWRNFIRIEAEPQSRATYYFKLEGTFHPDYPDRIALYHFDEEAYWVKKSFALFEDGAFLGMTLLLIVLGGILYYYGREHDNLFFLVYLAGVWIHDFGSIENMGASNFYSELFPNIVYGRAILSTIGFVVLTYGFTYFSVSFMDARQYAPSIGKVMTYFAHAIAVLFLVGLKCFDFFLFRNFEYSYEWVRLLTPILALLTVSIPFLAFALGLVALQKKHPLAKVFLFANLPVVTTMFISFVGELIFGNVFSSNIFHAASRISHLAQYTLFAVAIVYKRQIERNQILEKQLELDLRLNAKQQEAQRLQELDTFKSRLYTNLTHEFRTPLTVIIGMVEHMREAPKKYFDEGTQLIERNGRTMLRLINQLLDLSKLENHSFHLQLQQGDLVNYLRYLTESFQTYANSHNLSLRFSYTIEEQLMDYDPEQIKQVFTNLISNAVKFTPSGGHIQVKLSKEKEQLVFRIKDTGIGITKEDLPHIFDRFYQVDNSATRKSEGTGIGLAHTEELVKRMGGTIQVESQVNEGTTFIIALPITHNSPKLLNRPEIAVELEPAETSRFVPESAVMAEERVPSGELPQLLLIEDNHDVVVYLKACLEHQYQIDVAYNGKIGVEKALKTVPDIIISDVMMPEKDGYEVCDTLKHNERTSHIPVILLTAKAGTASKISGLRRGADAYLTKPFDKEELLVRLEMLLERQRRMAAYFSGLGTAGLTEDSLEHETSLTPEIIEVENAFLEKVRAIVEAHYSDEDFALLQLCKKVGMSRSQLLRKMKALIDESPSDFIRNYRLAKAKSLLETTDLNVSEVAWKVGYKDLAHFSKSFQKAFGTPPSSVNN